MLLYQRLPSCQYKQKKPLLLVALMFDLRNPLALAISTTVALATAFFIHKRRFTALWADVA